MRMEQSAYLLDFLISVYSQYKQEDDVVLQTVWGVAYYLRAPNDKLARFGHFEGLGILADLVSLFVGFDNKELSIPILSIITIAAQQQTELAIPRLSSVLDV